MKYKPGTICYIITQHNEYVKSQLYIMLIISAKEPFYKVMYLCSTNQIRKLAAHQFTLVESQFEANVRSGYYKIL